MKIEEGVIPFNEVPPVFTYHTKPLETGVFVPSEKECACCKRQRGLVYLKYLEPIIYQKDQEEPGEICPWCIADGSAAAKYQIYLVSPRALSGSNLPKHIVDEITFRTPAYTSWQEPRWMCHCNDACVFTGDLSIVEAKNPNWDAVMTVLNSDDWFFDKPATIAEAKTIWGGFAEYYRIAEPSVFKFLCRHCNTLFYQFDMP